MRNFSVQKFDGNGGQLGEEGGTHTFIDAVPHIEVLAGAVRLAGGVLLDAGGARLVRSDEFGALGLARLLEVGPVVNWVFVVRPG